MLDKLKSELEAKGVFSGHLPDIADSIVASIYNNRIPDRMKLTIAMSELITFASQFRINIHHWNGSSIPINAISFCISASGTGKDSGVSAARKCFKDGYNIIEERRKAIATQQAIQSAQKEGLKNPTEWEVYKKFYEMPNPLFVSPSTNEGFIQHLNALDASGIGAGYIYSGEFGAELVNKPLLIENIQLLSELYDEGSKEVKVLKNKENQSKEIHSLPVSALFMGSQANILYDEHIKKIFKREFSTKLARRSFWNFNPYPVEAEQFETVQDMLDAEISEENKAIEARGKVMEYVRDLTEYMTQFIGQHLEVDPEVRYIFTVYKRYNEEFAETIHPQYPISKLARSHMQWKALKLAGAIAIIEGEMTITRDHYINAISYAEMLNDDMTLFEAELVKEPYEVFVDYMHTIANDGKASLSLHMLRKLGYIPTSGTPTVKMKELISLATSYDNKGIYSTCDDGICYEQIQFTEISGVSYIALTGSKEERKAQCETGYQYEHVEFAELAEILNGDFAYTPFEFKHGKRSKANVISGCKWIALDIDDSKITDEECHFILQDINHHIARTSDPDNPFKFRLLLELDAMVDIPDIQWKTFIGSIANTLGIKADLLPKAQIYFAYKDRNVLSTIDGEPLEVKEHLIMASEKQPKEAKKISTKEAKTMLDDPLTTFGYAYYAQEGQRSRSLIRAAYHAKDLGASVDDIIELMYDINDYIDDPLPVDELDSTIISQIRRW